MATCLTSNSSPSNNGGSSSSVSSPEKPTPARNLTQAFEALCGAGDDDDGGGETASSTSSHGLDPVVAVASPSTKNEKLALISPTGVADLSQTQQTQSSSPPKPEGTAKNRNALTTGAGAGAGAGSTQTTATESAAAAADADNSNKKAPQRQPYLDLHPDLRRDLSQALVNRVSFYAIIHDINKEATAMACNDVLQQQALPENEDRSPLVVAALGGDAALVQHEAATTALIDEEEWLLSTIATRQDDKRRACPDTFLQAMGEKEYENPVASLAGNTRTQLWKPSRSWWEAKSGKNPWIEPASHNKRWRYLWPLIHYHKFLAKCIKKLKRNGVDVKQSVSPVAVFLREEVCAVSDHLASLSLFDSDEWMACLGHFHGWTDPNSEEIYRDAVAGLKLRPLAEPSDVESPLLRSQIDEQFLRTMATARAQLREAAPTERKKKTADGQPPVYPRGSPVPKHIHPNNNNNNSDTQRQRHPRWPYPTPPPQQVQGGQQQQGWWNHHWDPSQQQQLQGQPSATQPYCDSSSVHSGLSADSSYPQPSSQTAPPMYPPYPMHNHLNPYYPYPPNSDNSHASGYNYSEGAMYDPHAMQHGAPPNGGWVDPSMMYAMQMIQQGYYPPHPPPQHQHLQQHHPMPPANSTASNATTRAAASADGNSSINDFQSYASSETPQKKPVDCTQSPFWSHLDQATLAMGLATPAKASPLTPRRNDEGVDGSEQQLESEQVEQVETTFTESTVSSTTGDDAGFSNNAQPLLLQHGQYYGYNNGVHYGVGGNNNGGGGGGEGYGPPSPATQFMMSPQASFAYSYGYGFSPGRQNARNMTTPRANRKLPPTDSSSSKQSSSRLEETATKTSKTTTTGTSLTPPPAVRKISPQVPSSERESPATVETSTESESLHETA